MIPHAQFSSLKLSTFCFSDSLYREWEDDSGDLVTESAHGVEVYRHAKVNSGTLGVYLDLLDHDNDPAVGISVLKHLGIPLSRVTTFVDMVGLFGEPSFSKLDPDRGYDCFRSDFYRFVISPPDGYVVCCSWLYPGSVGRNPPLKISEMSLWNVRIERDDFDSFPWSE